MFKHSLLVAMAAGLILAAGYADQSRKIVIGVQKTSPTDGKQMYTSYCAPCHGINGRGNGPAAQAMRTQPSDLTVLARANKGKFPETHVMAILQFGSEIPSHGSATMPIWGPIFGKMGPQSSHEKELRMGNLTRYLAGMQQK